MRAPLRFLFPALLAAAAAVPALAEQPVFTGASEQCMQARADVELGPVAIDLALAKSGLGGDGSAESRDVIGAVLRPILEQCIEAHGLPRGNPRDIGGYLIARATRFEAQGRLAERGIDKVWLESALAGKRGETGPEFRQVSQDVLARMRQPRPAGLWIDLSGADTDSRTTALLVHTYVSGTLTTALIGPKLKQ